MHVKWRGFCGIITLAASLVTLGCGNTKTTNVRAVNASPGFAPFSFQVGLTPLGSIPYGTEGVLPKGEYSIDSTGAYRIVAAGPSQNVLTYAAPGSTPFATAKQTFLAKTSYTIVSLGTAPGMELRALIDDDSAPQGGAYKLRLMDTSTIAGPVDVYITAVGDVPSGNLVVGNINFGQVTSYLQLSPGALEVQVTPQGDPSTVLFSTEFSPQAGKIYSVFFLDPSPTGPNVYGLLVVSDPLAGTMSSGG